MKNIRLTTQLGFALLAGFVLFVIASIIAIVSLDASDHMRQESEEQTTLLTNLLSGASLQRQVRLTAFRAAVAGQAGDTALQSETVQKAEQTLQSSQQLINSYLDRNDPNHESTAIDGQLRSAFTNFVNNLLVPTIEAARQGSIDDIGRLAVAAFQYNDAFNSALDATIAYRQQRAAETGVLTHQSIVRNQSLIVAGLVMAMLVAIATFMMLRRSVVKPLIRAQSHFARIAQGDVSQPIEVMGSNEIGQSYALLDKMQAMLKRDMLQVREGAQAIHHGAREIAQGNADLSSRTEQQAASLEQTASSMEQFMSTVRQNAANAGEASTLSNNATTVAERGGEEMKQVVGGMEDISKTAGQISSITAIIDGIAFQTNILALNASVEAARAGEHGRGFAVVADEVRNLATRSADAAGQIKKLIENVSGKIESGSKVAQGAGKTMQQVVTGIREVNQLISEIAAASKEQSDGIEQVNRAITEMDSVTQQNAALVEQAAAAAGSLEYQAGELAQAVERFRLGEESAATVDKRLHQQSAPAASPAAKTAKIPALKTPASHTGNKRVAAKSVSEGEWTEF